MFHHWQPGRNINGLEGRAYCTQLSARHKRKSQQQNGDLIAEISILEQTHKQSRALTLSKNWWQRAPSWWRQWGKNIDAAQLCPRNYSMTKATKCVRLLARRLRLKPSALRIYSIHDAKGKTLESSASIAQKFRHTTRHYTILKAQSTHTTYSEKCREDIKQILTAHCPTALSPDEAKTLHGPLTQQELLTAVSHMQNSKSPGPNGCTLQYYKTLLPHLHATFLWAFNTIHSVPAIPCSLLAAHIVVIPKGDKGPMQVANYHPISLLNVDVKICAKILAPRLSHYLPQ